MTQLTYRLTSPNTYRVAVDGVEIGSISLHIRHLHRIQTYWHWGMDIMPLMSHGGGVPSGDTEPPEDALKAFKEAFTQWRAGVPDDKWRENLEHKRAGQERWRRQTGTLISPDYHRLPGVHPRAATA